MLKTAVPQCDSDSFPPRGETDSRGFKGSPQDCPDFRCQPQVQYRGPQAIHLLTNCLQIQVLPWPPQVWWFTKMTDRTQESTTFAISFILEDTNQNKSKEETHKERFGRAANAELLCTLPVELGHVSLLPPPVTSVCVPTRTCPLSFGVRSFYWDFLMTAALAMSLDSVSSSPCLPNGGEADITWLKAPILCSFAWPFWGDQPPSWVISLV